MSPADLIYPLSLNFYYLLKYCNQLINITYSKSPPHSWPTYTTAYLTLCLDVLKDQQIMSRGLVLACVSQTWFRGEPSVWPPAALSLKKHQRVNPFREHFFLIKGLTTNLYFLLTTKVNSLGSFSWSFLSVLSKWPVSMLSLKNECDFDPSFHLSHMLPVCHGHSLELLWLSFHSCLWENSS